jgi:hypothetical protein
VSEGLTAEPDQTETPTVVPTAEGLPVYLETAVGPYFQDVFDQVLFKALKESVSANHKRPEHRAVQNGNSNLQLSRLRNSWNRKIAERVRKVGALIKRVTIY